MLARSSLFGLALAAASCGGVPAQVQAPEGAPSAPSTPGSANPVTEASLPGGASAAPKAPAPEKAAVPAREPVPVAGTYPEGVKPLSEPEAKELGTKCRPLTDAVTAAAKKSGRSKRPAELAVEILASPPAVKGVDVARCTDLMLRDLRVYLARTMESEAVMSLKRIGLGMSFAMEAEPPVFCPSAPAVPAKLTAIADAPYQAPAADWSAPGWKCVKFETLGAPQAWQYELKTDPSTKSFKAIARGYPVKGGPVSELFLEGRVEGGKIQPSSDVKRR